MKRYEFTPEIRNMLEASPLPFALYQFIEKKVVTLVLSQGFLDLFGYVDRTVAYYDMDNNMYREVHPDDIARISDAAIRFAHNEVPYDVVYRTKALGQTDYIIIHAIGKHTITEDGIQLAHVSYTLEGSYDKGTEDYGLSTSLKESMHEKNIVQSIRYDVLTGLPSMTYFFERADAEKQILQDQGFRAVLLFMDFNGMKAFNREYGFSVGDDLLRDMAKLLKKTFGSENCSRFGQDHFAVVTKSAGLEDILHGLFDEVKLLNDRKTLPLRVGIYLAGDTDLGVAGACDRAKYACDMERQAVASEFRYFDEKMLAEIKNRDFVISRLDQALTERWIEPYYQPIVRSVTGQVCDEEALARWHDPERGFLSPADFIDVLEKAKLIYKIDLYMVDRVLEDLVTKKDAGLSVSPVSINLSRSDYETCDIVEEIRRRVDDAGIERSMLNIEITESIVGRDFEYMAKQIERFHALGFKVWMDDFGSGYSSLDVLHRIPFDLIKFDMRFMEQKGDEQKSRIIFTELIKMALALGVETIAEGVETSDQVTFLREVGCTKMQGFYYNRPIPLSKVLERYEKGIQIGFENPEEADYYAIVGSTNLYDPSIITNAAEQPYQHYLKSVPMAVLELDEMNHLKILRRNASYQDFLSNIAFPGITDSNMDTISADISMDQIFLDTLLQCTNAGEWHQIDQSVSEHTLIHAFVRMISENPTTRARAYTVVVLAIIE